MYVQCVIYNGVRWFSFLFSSFLFFFALKNVLLAKQLLWRLFVFNSFKSKALVYWLKGGWCYCFIRTFKHAHIVCTLNICLYLVGIIVFGGGEGDEKNSKQTILQKNRRMYQKLFEIIKNMRNNSSQTKMGCEFTICGQNLIYFVITTLCLDTLAYTYTYTFWKFGARDEMAEQLCYVFTTQYTHHSFGSTFSVLFFWCFHTHVRLISREHGYGINKKCQFNGNKSTDEE